MLIKIFINLILSTCACELVDQLLFSHAPTREKMTTNRIFFCELPDKNNSDQDKTDYSITQ